MDCPRCGLLSPDGAQRCDCGYDFAERVVKESYLEAEQRRKIGDPAAVIRELGRRDIKLGSLCLALGIIFTVGTHVLAGRGQGRFTAILYGAVICGLIWLLRGIDRVRSGLDRPMWKGMPPS
jgi:hypothetical protein